MKSKSVERVDKPLPEPALAALPARTKRAVSNDSARHLQKEVGASSNELSVVPGSGETDDAALARSMIDPAVNSAITLQRIVRGRAGLDLNSTVAALEVQCRLANDGNLARGEAMLMAQAHVLDALWNQLLMRALENRDGELMEKDIRLALRAQSQCRMTIETLALIKNPPNLAFVKQQNVAGVLQVNNGAASVESRAMEISRVEQSKLLDAEVSHGKRVDNGSQKAAVAIDQSMEALGTLHRACDTEG